MENVKENTITPIKAKNFFQKIVEDKKAIMNCKPQDINKVARERGIKFVKPL